MEAEILQRRLGLQGLRILMIHTHEQRPYSIYDFGAAADCDTPSPALVYGFNSKYFKDNNLELVFRQ